MALLDHRKTWHFSVRATREQCFQAFERAMSHPGFKFLVARWRLERGTTSVEPDPTRQPWTAWVATYAGRGGIVGVMTDLMGGQIGEMTRNEVQQAVGYSQITFAVSPDSSNSRTECSMWLSQFSTKFGFTTDARFFRSSMRDVEKQLRTLDSALAVSKS